jgi:hypothetical protein
MKSKHLVSTKNEAAHRPPKALSTNLPRLCTDLPRLRADLPRLKHDVGRNTWPHTLTKG